MNDTLYKIFTGILHKRLNHWVDDHNILNEYQAGFRSGYSTIDNIFNLVNIVNLNKDNGKFTYAFFVDLKCAFDKIHRNLMFYKLTSYGLSAKTLRILRLLYSDTTSQIWDGCNLSAAFNTNCGVKQGCILSPLLFALFINDIIDAFPEGVKVAGTEVKALLYADDLVLLSDKPVGLQSMIDALQNYCQKWQLTVNIDKSKIAVFR